MTRPPPPPVDWASLAARPPSPDAGPPSATAKERAAADAYLAALASPASPDCAALAGVLDEDAHFAFAGLKDVFGRDNVVRAHQILLGAFEQRSFAVSRLLITHDSQIIEWVMTGVHKATHKRVAFKGLSLLWTKDDGAISNVRLYFDELAVSAQAGIGPKALRALPRASEQVGVAQAASREEVDQTRSPEESANVAVVRALLDAFENADADTYAGAMTDDVEVASLASVEPLRGMAAARAYVKAMHRSIAELDVSIDNVWGVGPFVVVEYHIVGEQRGPLGVVPAQKNNLFKMYRVDVARLRDGKIAQIQRYDNPAQILAAPMRQ
ncbi:MAG: ester cyclase [Polyangiaceae bacterium]|nr:ester cyclase [Polyangiaceae bacterium]